MLIKKVRQDKAKARLKTILNRLYFGFASAVYLGVLFTPSLNVFAQDTGTNQEAICQTPASISRPTGSSAWTFSYSCDSKLWENSYFTWNPNSSITTAKYPPVKNFNESTNMWEVSQWKYVASEATYRLRVFQSYSPVQPAEQTETPQTNQSNQQQSQSNQPSTSTNTELPVNIDGLKQGTNIPDTATILSGDNVFIANHSNDQIELDTDLNVDVAQNVDSISRSGDASVLQNTNAGSAQSGDAKSEAYILNMIRSMLGPNSKLPELYTSNIQGDHFGDIVIDPNLLAKDITVEDSRDTKLDINVSNDVNLENNVDLVAQSGNATVSKNTSAGDAKSGDASAIANIINMINSSIASDQSFLGVLNVNGNLDGDVLFADNLTDQLIAANVPSSTVSLTDSDIDVNLHNNINITDSIKADAQSGNATVSKNTSAGDAKSGDAQSDITVFNLIGHNVQADNALLIFVNVAGQWTGFITNAPNGSSAAAFGTNIKNNSASADIDIDNDINITNNVNLLAQTGDATVSMNTNAGDATSGNATANASVANIVNTSFDLSSYLAWLFINVTGDWCGSVGTDTDCGNPVVPTTPVVASASNLDPSTPTTNPLNIPSEINPQNIRIFSAGVVSGGSPENVNQPLVLSDATEIVPQEQVSQSFASPDPQNNNSSASWLFIGGIIIGYIVIFQSNRIMDIFRKS